MYKEYSPDIRLKHLIETYWVADGVVENSFLQRIMPDGCVDIIFDFWNNDGTGRLQTGIPELVGTKTSLFQFAYKPGHVQMLGIRFAPGAITALTRLPVYEITNESICLPLTETLLDAAFYERLPEMKQIEERIEYINRYFVGRLYKLYSPNRQIQYAVSLIRGSAGQMSVKQLASETCLCERHFERKFKADIGISPKIFSNITRFESARKYVRTLKDESLYSAAIACGYHDHSHMNKEFQRLGNISPSDLML